MIGQAIPDMNNPVGKEKPSNIESASVDFQLKRVPPRIECSFKAKQILKWQINKPIDAFVYHG